MASQDKIIKITFGVDEASAGKAKRVISDLVSEVSKLATATSKVNLGGLGGGGGGFGQVGALSGRGGGGSVSTQAGHKLSASTGGVTDGLTRAVQSTATLFRGAASGSKDAFKVMSDALKRHVSDSDNEIRRLQRSLEGLGKTYDKLKSRQASGGGALTEAGIRGVQDRYYETASQLSTAQKDRGKFRAQLDELETPGRQMGAARAWFKTNVPSIAQGGSALSSFANATGLGGMARFATGPAGMVGAVVSAASQVLSARDDNRMANLNYMIDKPTFGANARGQLGGIFGGNALAIRHGDLARSIAFQRLAHDGATKGIVGNAMEDLLRARREASTPVGLVENLAKGNFMSRGYAQFKDNLGVLGTKYLGQGQGGVDISTPGGQDQIARQRATAEQITQQAQMFSQRLEAKIAEDPEFNDRVNARYGGAMGTLGLARAAGVSNRVRRGFGADGRPTAFTGTAYLEALANSQGYDVGEYVGGMQQMAGTVGRSYMHRGTGSLLSAQAGGLSNIAQIRAMGSQFNGGEYRGFERNIQSRIGTGGVDITAGSQITGMGAGMMSANSFMGTGQGLMSTLLDAGYTGNGAMDMRQARAMSGGVSALTSVMSGGLDPLQHALNASAAMKAAPNAAYGTKQALMRMDPATMMDALRNLQEGKGIPQELAAAGVTGPMILAYAKAQNSTAFARVSEGMLGGDAAGAVGRYKKAGGLGYMKDMNRTQRGIEARGLASGMVTAGGAPDFASAMSRIRLQMASEGLLKGGKGRGAHSAASMDTFEGDAARNTAAEKITDDIKNVADNEMQRDAVRNMRGVKNALGDARKFSQNAATGTTPEAAIASVSQALTAFVQSLKTITDKPGARYGAPKTVAAH